MIGVLAWALGRKLFDLYVSHLKKDRGMKPYQMDWVTIIVGYKLVLLPWKNQSYSVAFG
jgi:alpha-mannosidase